MLNVLLLFSYNCTYGMLFSFVVPFDCSIMCNIPMQEIQIMQHSSGQSNIVEFKGSYDDKNYVYVVMELCRWTFCIVKFMKTKT